MPLARSPTSTATPASSSTAATRSSSSASTPTTSRSPTCSSTASCPPRSSSTTGMHEITIHTFVHENVKSFMQGFRYDAHPMGMLLAATGALSTFYPDANQIKDEEIRHMQIIRLLAKMPTLAAFAYRHNMGQPYVYPDNDLSYAGNFLSMMYKMTELKYEPDPRLERALDVLFILHADHEQNAPPTRCARSAPPRSIRTRPIAAGVAGALRPAARRRQRAGAADARPHRLGREHPRLPRGREGGQGAADGLRPPRLQELRPARPDHQEAPRRGLRGHGQEPAARDRRPSSRSARWTTTTSRRASSTRTSTSTRACSTRR